MIVGQDNLGNVGNRLRHFSQGFLILFGGLPPDIFPRHGSQGDEEVIILEHDRPVARVIGEPRQRKLAGGIGKLAIIEDDETHLEDFKEYMP
jgi:hypothetical protein